MIFSEFTWGGFCFPRGWGGGGELVKVRGQSSSKTVTSEFVQPKKSILWFRK